MNIKDAEILAKRLIREHLDDSWTFRWNKRKAAFGICNYNTRKIELSSVLTELEDPFYVEQTILHEIAHALVGYAAGHNREWKRCARELGVVNPKSRRNISGNTKPAYKWAIKYNGEIVKGYHRKPNKDMFTRVHNMYLTNKVHTKGKLYIEEVA